MPTPPMPTASSSFNSPHTSTPPPSSKGNGSALPYTPYQPPPIRQDGLTSQQSLTLRDIRLLEPEPVSPSASTLVGSPMTPHGDGRRRFSWFGNSGDQPLNGATGSPEELARSGGGGSNVASTYRSGVFGIKRKSFSNSKGDQDFSSPVGPASAARTLGYHDHSGSGGAPPFSPHHSHHYNSNQHHPGGGGGSNWEPHVSVMMDEISLDSFVPSDTPYKKSHYGGIYNKAGRSRSGRASPAASDFGQSSNTSMVTLLAQTNTASTNSSSATLFGGFMSKSKSHNSFKKLNDSQEDLIEAAQQQQHQTVTMSAGGKAYSKKPKDKKFGKKGGGGGGGKGGDGGNSDRKALFSNERTLVHWIKFGILLGTMALTLCNFGRIGSLAFYIGSSMLLVAMTTLGYAIFTFHYRDRSLSRRLTMAMARKKAKRNKKGAEAVDPATLIAKEVCYYDRKGPTIVCCLLIFACSINFYRKWHALFCCLCHLYRCKWKSDLTR
ncbi:hypothetical protein BGZ96_003313 [Linnemannia gamsii]|uniref:DUF202 domain-containing protein n=1 Tax=Linnemannia gamsii TaxID=64522 RepID=A0ABQ7KH43_9FUNG|nr:hypothetical protein BGZ96_003313 [Linnemannia gamsii]